MSRFIDVFKLTGHAMQKKGSFFALMFLAMACGCLVVYFVLGWTSNVVAQVRNSLGYFELENISDYLLDIEPQVPKGNHQRYASTRPSFL